MQFFRSLLTHQNGSAAVEMVLILPISLLLMFGAADLGNYFHKEHIVVGAVRDGARFAARQQFDFANCDFADTNAPSNIRKATRLFSLAGADDATNRRIGYWDNDASVAINVSCADRTGYSGLYADVDDLPRVTIDAEIQYRSLFSTLGLGGMPLRIKAVSEAAVMGG
jgi:hypothetical protein